MVVDTRAPEVVLRVLGGVAIEGAIEVKVAARVSRIGG
jgi:hypothetical protein